MLEVSPGGQLDVKVVLNRLSWQINTINIVYNTSYNLYTSDTRSTTAVACICFFTLCTLHRPSCQQGDEPTLVGRSANSWNPIIAYYIGFHGQLATPLNFDGDKFTTHVICMLM